MAGLYGQGVLDDKRRTIRGCTSGRFLAIVVEIWQLGGVCERNLNEVRCFRGLVVGLDLFRDDRCCLPHGEHSRLYTQRAQKWTRFARDGARLSTRTFPCMDVPLSGFGSDLILCASCFVVDAGAPISVFSDEGRG
jgi:hypothetical protein